MMRFFDQEGNPISPTTWALMLEDGEHRIIEQTWIGDVTVSTVWLGMDQSFGQGSEPALIFETMVFGGEHDHHRECWPTKEAAQAGHERTVAWIRQETREASE